MAALQRRRVAAPGRIDLEPMADVGPVGGGRTGRPESDQHWLRVADVGLDAARDCSACWLAQQDRTSSLGDERRCPAALQHDVARREDRLSTASSTNMNTSSSSRALRACSVCAGILQSLRAPAGRSRCRHSSTACGARPRWRRREGRCTRRRTEGAGGTARPDRLHRRHQHGCIGRWRLRIRHPGRGPRDVRHRHRLEEGRRQSGPTRAPADRTEARRRYVQQ